MSCPTTDDLIEAAKAIEAITGVAERRGWRKRSG